MVGVPLQLTLLMLPALLLASPDSRLSRLEMTEQAAIAVDSECSNEESDHCSIELRQLRVRTQKETDLSSDNILNPSCSAHPGCAALSGDCCPTSGGTNLGCCSESGAKTPSGATPPSPSTTTTTQGATSAEVAARPSPSPIPQGLPNLKTSAGGGGQTMTLYHITNPEAGAAILKSEFRPGKKGWCGGAIYFTPSPYDCWHKAAPGMLAKGFFMIEAQVDIGRSKSMPNYCTSPTICTLYNIVYCGCDEQNRGAQFLSEGYDSLNFNPGDGMEYIIWDPKRVKSMKQIAWPPGAPPAPPPPPPSPWGYIPPYYW